jgi:hypothetical protein
MNYEDINMVCSMITRNRVSDRLYIHFNIIGFDEIAPESVYSLCKGLFQVI